MYYFSLTWDNILNIKYKTFAMAMLYKFNIEIILVRGVGLVIESKGGEKEEN